MQDLSGRRNGQLTPMPFKSFGDGGIVRQWKRSSFEVGEEVVSETLAAPLRSFDLFWARRWDMKLLIYHCKPASHHDQVLKHTSAHPSWRYSTLRTPSLLVTLHLLFMQGKQRTNNKTRAQRPGLSSTLATPAAAHIFPRPISRLD